MGMGVLFKGLLAATYSTSSEAKAREELELLVFILEDKELPPYQRRGLLLRVWELEDRLFGERRTSSDHGL